MGLAVTVLQHVQFIYLPNFMTRRMKISYSLRAGISIIERNLKLLYVNMKMSVTEHRRGRADVMFHTRLTSALCGGEELG
jgi:hypothetical protein